MHSLTSSEETLSAESIVAAFDARHRRPRRRTSCCLKACLAAKLGWKDGPGQWRATFQRASRAVRCRRIRLSTSVALCFAFYASLYNLHCRKHRGKPGYHCTVAIYNLTRLGLFGGVMQEYTAPQRKLRMRRSQRSSLPTALAVSGCAHKTTPKRMSMVMVENGMRSTRVSSIKDLDLVVYQRQVEMKLAAMGYAVDVDELPEPPKQALGSIGISTHAQSGPAPTESAEVRVAKQKLAALSSSLPELLQRLDGLDGVYVWDKECEELLSSGIRFVVAIRKLKKVISEDVVPPVLAATLFSCVDFILKQRKKLQTRSTLVGTDGIQINGEGVGISEVEEVVEDSLLGATGDPAAAKIHDRETISEQDNDAVESTKSSNHVEQEVVESSSLEPTACLEGKEEETFSDSIPAAGTPCYMTSIEACNFARFHAEQSQDLVRMAFNAFSFGAFRSAEVLAGQAAHSIAVADKMGESVPEAVQGPTGCFLAAIKHNLGYFRRCLSRAVEVYSGMEFAPLMELGEEGLWRAITAAQNVADGLVPVQHFYTRDALRAALEYIDARVAYVGASELVKQGCPTRADLQAMVAGVAVLAMLQGAMGRPEMKSIKWLYKCILIKILDLLHILCIQQGYEGAVFDALGVVSGPYVHANLKWVVDAVHSRAYLPCIHGFIVGTACGPRVATPVVHGPFRVVPTPLVVKPRVVVAGKVSRTISTSSNSSGITSGQATPRSEQGAVVMSGDSTGDARKQSAIASEVVGKRSLSRLGSGLRADAAVFVSQRKSVKIF